MKKSTSIVLSSLVAFGMLSSVAYADGNIKKGQKTYLKKCKKCHGNGTKGAAMHSQDEWTALFADDAKAMIDAHKDDKKSKKYFGSKKFKKYAPHLKAFLWEYANDSGNVPSCG